MTPEALLAHLDSAELWPSAGSGYHDLRSAYAAALAVRALRVARGERPVGYKVGFTNRNIWERYGVFAPIWGTVWNTTASHCDSAQAIDVTLTGICQPRLEPEIVFGMARTPPPQATLEQVFGCIDWLAPGFEIVQSHCAGWKFSAPDTVADGSLHARLLVGRRIQVNQLAATAEELDGRLAAAQVHLFHDGKLVETGAGAYVLDSPLRALRHFVLELALCAGAPALLAGDIVTTGTWTDAWPMAPGQAWRADFSAPFGPLLLRT